MEIGKVVLDTISLVVGVSLIAAGHAQNSLFDKLLGVMILAAYSIPYA